MKWYPNVKNFTNFSHRIMNLLWFDTFLSSFILPKIILNIFLHESFYLSITHFLLCSSVIIGSIDLRKLVSRWIFVEFWLCDIQDRTNLVILSSFLIDLMWSLRCKKITDDHSLSEKFLLRQNTRIWYMLRVLKSKFL